MLGTTHLSVLLIALLAGAVSVSANTCTIRGEELKLAHPGDSTWLGYDGECAMIPDCDDAPPRGEIIQDGECEADKFLCCVIIDDLTTGEQWCSHVCHEGDGAEQSPHPDSRDPAVQAKLASASMPAALAAVVVPALALTALLI